MRTATVFLFLVFLACQLPALAETPEESVWITFAWIDGTDVPVRVTEREGAAPATAGDRTARLLDADGAEIWRGQIAINRVLHHDYRLPSGELRGGRSTYTGPVRVAIPWHENATHLEIVRPGISPLRHELPALSQPETPAARPARTQGAAPDFAGVIERTTAPVRNRLTMTPARVTAAANQKVTFTYSLPGITEADKKSARISLTFHDAATGALLAEKEFAPFSLKKKKYVATVPAQSLTIRASARIGRGALYPRELVIIGHNLGGGTVPLNFSAEALVEGTVTFRNAAAPARIIVVEEDTASNRRFSSYTAIETKADGSFSFFAAKRSLAFVVIPAGTQAEQMVAVRNIKPKKKTGVSRQMFALQPAGSFGTAEKYYVWHTGPDTDRFTFVYLSSGYTDLQEPFEDANNNGVHDGDWLLDENNNGSWDSGEWYRDRNSNGLFDKGESFTDLNGDTICNRDERAEFVLTAAWMTAKVLAFSPFDRYSDSFNVYAVWVPSQHSIPRLEEFPAPYNSFSTAFDVSGNSQSIYGYRGKFQLYTSANWWQIYQAAGQHVPDHVFWVVLMRDPLRVMISNAAIMQSAADHRDGRVLIHEMGHHVGGLADEYIYGGSDWQMYSGPEPDYPNLTIQTNLALVKWSKFFSGTPAVPTPEGTPGYGLFEGGSWVSGVYRPTSTSMMRSTNEPFYLVNEEALTAVLERYR